MLTWSTVDLKLNDTVRYSKSKVKDEIERDECMKKFYRIHRVGNLLDSLSCFTWINTTSVCKKNISIGYCVVFSFGFM